VAIPAASPTASRPAPGTATEVAEQPHHAHHPHQALWSWRRWAVAIVSLALLAVAVRAEVPLIGESARSFGRLRWPPVVWAVLAETG
jgi:hypothetical protein